ncbi:MAG: MmgE/PrpD family protein [Sulfolobales archaeon]
MERRSLAQVISEFIYNLSYSDIPSSVIEKAKIHILDLMGIMMAMHSDENVKKVVNMVRALGGSEESVVIGHGFRVAAASAVIANASMAHSADYDDTHLEPIIHPSCVAIPTALAMGEAMDIDGKRFVEAVVASYEVSIRIALAAGRKLHERGFHPTSVVGVFGAVAASSKILNLDPSKILNALGIAGSMASGIMQGHREGIWLKPLHPAIASHNGILASLLAMNGVEGPKMVLEGEWGFFRSYLWGEEPVFGRVVEDLGVRWETLNIAIKPYPVGHAAVAPIDTAIMLREKYGVGLSDIKELIFYLPKTAIDLVCEPWEKRIRPRNPYEAKFSVPFLAIIAIKKGWVGLRDFTWENIGDEELLKYTGKVKCIHDPEYDRLAREAVIPARAKLLTTDGRAYEEEVINHRGSPKNPFTWGDEEKKFYENIANTKFAHIGRDFVDAIKSIERHSIRYIANMLY